MGTLPHLDPSETGITTGVGESSKGPLIGVSTSYSRMELVPNWMVWLTPEGIEEVSPGGGFTPRGGKPPPSAKVRASVAGGIEGASKARQGSETTRSTPSTLTKVCVGLLSPSASASNTGEVSTPTGPELSPMAPLPPAREETGVQDIAERGGSPFQLASSAKAGAGAQEGVISPSNSPIASTVLIRRVEALKAPLRTSKGHSRVSGNPLGSGVTGTPRLARTLAGKPIPEVEPIIRSRYRTCATGLPYVVWAEPREAVVGPWPPGAPSRRGSQGKGMGLWGAKPR